MRGNASALHGPLSFSGAPLRRASDATSWNSATPATDAGEEEEGAAAGGRHGEGQSESESESAGGCEVTGGAAAATPATPQAAAPAAAPATATSSSPQDCSTASAACAAADAERLHVVAVPLAVESRPAPTSPAQADARTSIGAMAAAANPHTAVPVSAAAGSPLQEHTTSAAAAEDGAEEPRRTKRVSWNVSVGPTSAGQAVFPPGTMAEGDEDGASLSRDLECSCASPEPQRIWAHTPLVMNVEVVEAAHGSSCGARWRALLGCGSSTAAVVAAASQPSMKLQQRPSTPRGQSRGESRNGPSNDTAGAGDGVGRPTPPAETHSPARPNARSIFGSLVLRNGQHRHDTGQLPKKNKARRRTPADAVVEEAEEDEAEEEDGQQQGAEAGWEQSSVEHRPSQTETVSESSKAPQQSQEIPPAAAVIPEEEDGAEDGTGMRKEASTLAVARPTERVKSGPPRVRAGGVLLDKIGQQPHVQQNYLAKSGAGSRRPAAQALASDEEKAHDAPVPVSRKESWLQRALSKRKRNLSTGQLGKNTVDKSSSHISTMEKMMEEVE